MLAAAEKLRIIGRAGSMIKQIGTEARIDRLLPEDKRLLQTASVVGKDVPIATESFERGAMIWVYSPVSGHGWIRIFFYDQARSALVIARWAASPN